jgi:transcriptional regulator with XRE-family HTH domain
LLDWTQAKLAEAGGLLLSAVVRFERGGRTVAAGAVQAMKRALESAGVEFISENGSGAGVRMKKGKLN